MTRPLTGRLTALLVAAFWVVMTALLLMRHYGPAATPRLSPSGPLPAAIFGEQWFGVYQKDARIGYATWDFRRRAAGYAVENTLKLRLRVLGATRDMEARTRALLGHDLALESFDLALRADLDLRVTGRVQGNNLGLIITSEGVRTERTIRLKDRPVLDLSMPPSLVSARLKPGQRHQMTVFDPASLSLQPLTLIVEPGGPMQVMGRTVDTLLVKGSLGGGEMMLWVTKDGDLVRQESPLGFTLMRERREDALRTGEPSVDMAEAAAVPFGTVLPENLSYLKVRITGIGLTGLDLHGGGQTLTGNVLEVRSVRPGDAVSGRDGPVSPAYLEDGLFIQTKDKGIVSLAKKITGGEKDPVKASRLINAWVYRNIEKTPLVTVPLSPAVLKAARGDCNEHAVLFASLARAAGVPARIALGLVHQDGRFYYHAWNEVHAGTWIPVDPTFGQFPADAAHIRLLAGDLDKQTRLAGLIGKIRLQGLAFR